MAYGKLFRRVLPLLISILGLGLKFISWRDPGMIAQPRAVRLLMFIHLLNSQESYPHILILLPPCTIRPYSVNLPRHCYLRQLIAIISVLSRLFFYGSMRKIPRVLFCVALSPPTLLLGFSFKCQINVETLVSVEYRPLICQRR